MQNKTREQAVPRQKQQVYQITNTVYPQISHSPSMFWWGEIGVGDIDLSRKHTPGSPLQKNTHWLQLQDVTGFEAPQGSFAVLKVQLWASNTKPKCFFPFSWMGIDLAISSPFEKGRSRHLASSCFRQVKRWEKRTLPLYPVLPNNSSFVCYIDCLLGLFVTFWFFELISR